MTNGISRFSSPRVTPVASLVIFAVSVCLMAWLRLVVYADQYIVLTYGLPLLVCLWYRDRRLLWSMTAAFLVLAAYKAFVLMPMHEPGMARAWSHWTMQLINMTVIAGTVHLVVKLTERLRAQNLQLEKANHELTAREEEISRQNEELQAQNEELAEQNEEIQQQSEEIQQQSEELQVQTEELQAINFEQGRRQAMLETLLDALHLQAGEPKLPEHVCKPLLALFGRTAGAVAIVEKIGDELVVLAHAGVANLAEKRWRVEHSFGAVVVQHNRTAFVADLATRPDLRTARSAGAVFRSVIGTPLRLAGRTIGLIEVFAHEPREWTTEEFKILEWASRQCSLLMEIRRLQSELMHRNADLDQAVKARTAELQDLVHELEHFSYTITHDMRAPLRAMQGYADVLAEECRATLSPAGREYLQRIATAAARMDRLITDALSYSKVVRHEMPIVPLDAGHLIRGMIDSYPMFQPPQAKVEVAADMPRVLGNEAGLTQCFSNLLGNAVKFVGKDRIPHVKVGAERADDMVRLWVEDNGIGIPSEMQSRVFGMFQRLSKDYEGTGIGLALVQKVTRRMGGKVGVQSEPGKGSRFWIELRPA